MDGVKALLFDVFGTAVDWRSSVEAELAALGSKHGLEADWAKFAQEWRMGYTRETQRIAKGGEGTANVDLMHRQILDSMLASPEWSFVKWSEEERAEINLVWHRLRGWPDTTEGLYALKRKYILGALSNGNVKLLVDMAKFADLPWDVVFGGDLFGTCKPNPKMYLSAIHYLSLKPSEVAMVAAHAFDLKAAGTHGMPTIYIPRPQEEADLHPENIKSKAEGGEVDIVVDSFVELAEKLGCSKV